jgi:hypothetical protein
MIGPKADVDPPTVTRCELLTHICKSNIFRIRAFFAVGLSNRPIFFSFSSLQFQLTKNSEDYGLVKD